MRVWLSLILLCAPCLAFGQWQFWAHTKAGLSSMHMRDTNPTAFTDNRTAPMPAAEFGVRWVYSPSERKISLSSGAELGIKSFRFGLWTWDNATQTESIDYDVFHTVGIEIPLYLHYQLGPKLQLTLGMEYVYLKELYPAGLLPPLATPDYSVLLGANYLFTQRWRIGYMVTIAQRQQIFRLPFDRITYNAMHFTLGYQLWESKN